MGYADRVRNGGEVVICSGDISYQSLDFVMIHRPQRHPARLNYFRVLKQSLEHILVLLQEKIPQLSPSFEEFMNQIGNQDLKKHYQWKPYFSPLRVYDEQIKLPISCNNGKGGIEILQAIVRLSNAESKTTEDKIIFEFDLEIFESLLHHDQFQLSFLIIHEWLWNFAPSIENNRKMNMFLHSEAFDKMTALEASKKASELLVGF